MFATTVLVSGTFLAGPCSTTGRLASAGKQSARRRLAPAQIAAQLPVQQGVAATWTRRGQSGTTRDGRKARLCDGRKARPPAPRDKTSGLPHERHPATRASRVSYTVDEAKPQAAFQCAPGIGRKFRQTKPQAASQPGSVTAMWRISSRSRKKTPTTWASHCLPAPARKISSIFSSGKRLR
jgi:hypothetical protein